MCFANKERLFSRMSRVKSRTQIEICGDCGAGISSSLLVALSSVHHLICMSEFIPFSA